MAIRTRIIKIQITDQDPNLDPPLEPEPFSTV